MEKFKTYGLVTVVIPTWNRASLVSKAIASVLAQTYSNLEVIIADDGSTDSTKEIVQSFDDPRVHLLSLQHSGHIGRVRNAGARAGTGHWIAFLDSDDCWFPAKLEQQVNKLKETSRRWCYTQFELMNEAGFKIPPKAGNSKTASGKITGQLLTNEVAVVVCTLLLERKLFESIGGFSEEERLAYRGDYEFAIRLSMKEEAVGLSDTLVRVLEHSGRSTNSLRNPYERSAVPYAVFLEQGTDPQLRKIARRRKAWLLAEAAVHRSAAGEHRTAWNHLFKAAGKDNLRHWLSAAYRSVKHSFVKSKPAI